MKFDLQAFRLPTVIGSLAFGTVNLTGCVTYDPPPQESKPVPAQVDSWSHISIKSWGELSFDKRDEALALLGNKDAVPISKASYEELSHPPNGIFPAKPLVIPRGNQLYLVKGRGYAITGGKVRFNTKTRELSVFLVAYNGEMSFPSMRWSVEDLPLVVVLPAAPSKVHKSAEIGGDSILRFMDGE
jgi:hypothetical protein